MHYGTKPKFSTDKGALNFDHFSRRNIYKSVCKMHGNISSDVVVHLLNFSLSISEFICHLFCIIVPVLTKTQEPKTLKQYIYFFLWMLIIYLVHFITI